MNKMIELLVSEGFKEYNSSVKYYKECEDGSKCVVEIYFGGYGVSFVGDNTVLENKEDVDLGCIMDTREFINFLIERNGTWA